MTSPDPRPCSICNSSWSTRIAGWLLSGENPNNIIEWCRELDPPVECSKHILDDHLYGGHIEIGKVEILGMAVKWNQQATDVIQNAIDNPTRIPRGALNVAMTTRQRTLEMIAAATGVIKKNTEVSHQELNLMLTADQQKAMIQQAAKALLPEPAKQIEDDREPTPSESPQG